MTVQPTVPLQDQFQIFARFIASISSWEAVNADLEARCHTRQNDILRVHKKTIGERLQRDLVAMKPLPRAPFEACAQASGQVSSQSLARCETDNYSIPVAYISPATAERNFYNAELTANIAAE